MAPRVFGCQAGYVVTSRYRHLSSADYDTPLPARPPLLTQEEMVARIEAARLKDAPPICPTCHSTVDVTGTRKWCPGCRAAIPVGRFSKSRSRWDGRANICKYHAAQQSKAYRSRVAKNGGIGATGVVVKVNGRMGRTV
jgi:hypothetical protein